MEVILEVRAVGHFLGVLVVVECIHGFVLVDEPVGHGVKEEFGVGARESALLQSVVVCGQVVGILDEETVVLAAVIHQIPNLLIILI